MVQGAQRIPCDAVLMSGGFTPSVHLFSQSRGKLVWNDTLKAFVPGVSAEGERSAGACRGVYALADVLADGAAAGAAAAGAAAAGAATTGFAPSPPPEPGRTLRRFAVEAPKRSHEAYLGALPQASPPSADKAFVDWQHDVTTRDLALATREGFQSIEHVKRYTTTGMATDQGKTSNLNAMAIVAKSLDVAIPQVGLTTFRMPYTPVTFGSFAGISRGDLFDPVRTTPTHDWAQAKGAVFENVGLWKRARYFPRGGEDMHAAVARECRAVRSACGIFDASTLGKIEVVGADAAEFMNRLYVNNWSSLGVGRSRYGILLREDGFVYDDGVVARTGRGSLPRDHHHRRRAAGARHDGRLSPDRMAGSQGVAHLHHRAMGGDRGAGSEFAPGARDAGRGHRYQRRRLAAHERRRAAHLRRAHAAVSRELHRRIGLRDQCAGRLRPAECGRRFMPRARRTA